MNPTDTLKSLLDAAEWCRSRIDLRSSELRPETLLVDTNGAGHVVTLEPAESLRVIERLAQRRAAGCERAGLTELDGRLLAFDYLQTLSDGAAEDLSGGYFDAHNQPPWDTWICLVGEATLLSWVPRAFVARADAGIYANPEQCIYWW